MTDWKALGRTLAGIGLPILGAQLGGPAGAAIGRKVAAAAGVADDPAVLAQAVAAGDPELMLRLVELEAAERERDRAAALEAQRIAAEDLRQAREAHRGHWMPAVLTLALAATVAALLAGLFLVEIPAANQRAADIVLGALLGAFTTGVAYWLGSSRGSAEKSSEIATLKGGR